MDHESSKNREPIEEVSALRKRIKELEQSEADRKPVEDDLSFSRQRLRLLIDAAPDFFFLKDLDLRYQLVNTANAGFFGREEADILGKTDMELMPEDAAVSCQESDRQAIREKRIVISSERVGDRCYETHKFPVFDAGEIVGVAGIVRDITERKRSEEALHRLNRELRAIRDCGQTLMRTEDEQSLLNDVCRIICDVAGYRMAWAGYVENDQAKTVRPVAWAGSEDDYLSSAHITWADTEHGRGPTGTAIRTGESMCIQNFAADPQAAPWREEALRRGYRSNIALPLRDENGGIFAVLNIYSTESDAFTEEEVRLMEQLAGDLAFGINVLRTRAERRKAEEDLRASERKYRSVIENIQDVYYRSDGGGILTMGSPSGAVMFGYDSADEMIGLPVDIFWPDPEERLQLLDRIKEKGSVKDFEVVLKKKDGSTFNASFTTQFYYDDQGNFLGTEGIIRDISEHKRTEEALRVALRRVMDIIEFLPDATFVIDHQGKVVAWNKAIEEMTGVKKENIIGKGDYAYAVPFYGEPRPIVIDVVRDRSEKNISKYNYIEEQENILLAEVYAPTAYQGRGAYLSARASPLFDSQGNIVGAIESIRDITERKHIAEELEESEERYRTAIESSTDGITMVKNGRHFYVNKKFLEIFGFDSSDQVVGQPVAFVVHPDDRERIMDIYRRRQSGEEAPQNYEFKGVKTNGDIIFIEVSATATTYKGEPISLAYLRDVTTRRQLEAQLLQSQKMQAIGTLAGGIAHDFNNILTALIGYGTILRTHLGRDNPLSIYVDHILSSSEKAAQLTQSLLAFSRKQPMALKPVKLNSVIKGTGKLLRRLLTEDIGLETILTSDDTTILGDATQIDQILFNLTTNARDAMPKGGTLTIETKRVVIDSEFARAHGYGKTGTYALISISDTGNGMDEGTQEHIFDPFFTTKEVGKGTGLGLSTVYGIVKQHNGYITVYSKPGIGTTFYIYLPAVTAAVEEERAVLPEVRRGDETILVAEDNEGVRILIKTVLTNYGYTVIEAVDGEDAIEKFSTRDKIDLLIIDSVMPKKNGREVYDEICKRDPNVRTLFMSGYTKDIILDKGVEERSVHFVSKPLSPNELLGKVREVLDGA